MRKTEFVSRATNNAPTPQRSSEPGTRTKQAANGQSQCSDSMEDIYSINQNYQEGNHGVDEEIGRGEFNASILAQCWLLTARMLKNQWRNPSYMYSKI